MCNQEWRGDDKIAEMYALKDKKEQELKQMLAIICFIALLAISIILVVYGE